MRLGCNACTKRRTWDAKVVEEWWKKSNIPHAALGQNTAARPPSTPTSTGRRPIPIAGNREGGGEADPRRRAQGGVEEARAQAEERRRTDGGKAETTGEGAKGKGKGGNKDGSKEGKEQQPKEEGEEGQCSKEEQELPPERTFEMPPVPRQALAELTKAQESKLEKLRLEGASASRVQKAEQRKKSLEEQLRAAGGKSSQTLGHQIRREEDNKEKAEASIRRIDSENAEYEEQIKGICHRVEGNLLARERFIQRKTVAEQRLSYLVAQKTKESLPTPFMQRVREATAIIAASEDETLLPVKEFLAVLAANPEGHYLGSDSSGDESQGESNATEEIKGRTGLEDSGGYEEFEEERRSEIAERRRRLGVLQAKYQQGLEEAFAGGAKGVKRGCGENEEKNKPDEKMEDEKETSVLNPAQVVAAFRPRIKKEADELRQLENASAKEVVPVTQAPVAAANALAPCKAKEEEQESRRQPITAGRRRNKWEGTSEAAEASMEADGEQKTEGGAPQKAQKTRKQHPPIEAGHGSRSTQGVD